MSDEREPTIVVPLETLKVLYDLSLASSGFEAGSMENADVVVLRRVAVLLGCDPIEAVPWTWRNQYAHRFVAMSLLPDGKPAEWAVCASCMRSKGISAHDGVSHNQPDESERDPIALVAR